jgi:hypothetical protein
MDTPGAPSSDTASRATGTRPRASAACVLLLLLAACTPVTPVLTPAPNATRAATAGAPLPASPAATAPVPPTPPATDTPLPAASPAPALGRPAQALDAALDLPAHTLAVRQVLTYPNTSGVALDTLVFDVAPDAQPGVLALESFSVDGAPVAPARDGPHWTVSLPRPLAPGALARIETRYTLALPSIPAGASDSTGGFGWTVRQTNLSDWYPVVAPYRDGAWLVHAPFGAGENLALEAADFDVTLTLQNAPGASVAASAAGTAGEAGGATRWRFTANVLRSFALSVSPEYVVTEQRVDGVLVRAYLFPEHQEAGAAALAAVARALQVYGQAYGPYPDPQFSLVEADFGDGLELGDMVFLGYSFFAEYDGTPRNWLTLIGAHETAHQWWYNQVGNDQALEPWLDEALCTYSELVFYENVYPDAVDWWWDFRIRRFAPQGYVDSTIYDLPEFRPYVNAVYLRGALFLSELRAAMGDEAFFAFLRRYVAANRGRIATRADFWVAAGDVPARPALEQRYFAPPSPAPR